MNNNTKMPVYVRVLMVLAMVAMLANIIHRNFFRESDEEVQQRMQEGLESQRIMEQARESEAKWQKEREAFDKQFNKSQSEQK